MDHQGAEGRGKKGSLVQQGRGSSNSSALQGDCWWWESLLAVVFVVIWELHLVVIMRCNLNFSFYM